MMLKSNLSCNLEGMNLHTVSDHVKVKGTRASVIRVACDTMFMGAILFQINGQFLRSLYQASTLY